MSLRRKPFLVSSPHPTCATSAVVSVSAGMQARVRWGLMVTGSLHAHPEPHRVARWVRKAGAKCSESHFLQTSLALLLGWKEQREHEVWDPVSRAIPCWAGPAVVTIPGSGTRGAGSRSPKQEAWGGGRKAVGPVGTLGPACQHHSGCGERRKQSGVGVGQSSALRTTCLPPPFKAREGLASLSQLCSQFRDRSTPTTHGLP